MKTDQEPTSWKVLYSPNANGDVWMTEHDVQHPPASTASLRRGAHHHGGDGSDLERFLSETRRNADGTLAVLAIVFALFCFIWAPVMFRRCRHRGGRSSEEVERAEMARFEIEARAMRATLQRMSMMGNLMAEQQQREALRGSTSNRSFGNGMQQHRREFLDNALLTKQIIFRSEEEDQNDKKSDPKEKQEEDKTDAASSSSKERKLPKRQKSNVIVLTNSTTGAKRVCQDEKDVQTIPLDKDSTPKSKEDEVSQETPEAESSPPTTISFNGSQEEIEPCSICLTEYSDGDKICWSQNDKCNHFFHKECILSWLLNHEECPCCRQNFLCLWGDEDEEDGTSGSAASRFLHHHHRSTLGMSSSSASNARDTSGLDWASELAEEINQRILQRQRQLHVELERRERELQLQQLELQLSTTTSLSPPSAARGIIGIPQRNLNERNLSVRNHVISVDDLAAGLLLYRHFPMQFASDPRRLSHRAPAVSSSSARSPRSNERGNDEDDDIHVAHFGVASSPQGLEPWQTYRHGMPSTRETPPWVVATSTRAMPSTRLSLNLPAVLSATATSSRTRASSLSPTRSDGSPARTRGSNGDGDEFDA